MLRLPLTRGPGILVTCKQKRNGSDVSRPDSQVLKDVVVDGSQAWLGTQYVIKFHPHLDKTEVELTCLSLNKWFSFIAIII
jgi:hypothetical protein